MSTPFAYPNGDFIDVFLENSGDMFESFLLSDYGLTGIYLHNARVELEPANKRRRQLVEDMAAALGVSLSRGRLQVQLEPSENPDFSDAIFRLSQACVKISDLAYHARLSAALPFKEDIGEFLVHEKFKPRRDEQIAGRFGRRVKVDFAVEHRQPSYLLTMASKSDSAVHNRANEVFTKWSSVEEPPDNLITVVSAHSIKAMRSDDKKRIQSTSHLFVYPEDQHDIVGILRRVG